MTDYINRKVAFIKPINGDVLNRYDGNVENGVLFIRFFVKAEKGKTVFVNGSKAEYSEGFYQVTLPVKEGKGTFRAECDGESDTITVNRIEKTVGKYRLSSDDNIIFLYNINRNKEIYKSIFEDPYLAIYKKAHDLYGTKVHLNLFYQMCAHPNFTKKRDDFDLSMMTDRFKREWEENSDWLKLNFHANIYKPDKPYIDAGYDVLYQDCERVMKEICRFAGEKTLSEETTIHWGATTEEGVRAVRDLGIRVLAGYLKIEGEETVVSYHYPKMLVSHLEGRDFWYDEKHNLYVAKIDSVLNMHTLEEIEGMLNILCVNKNCSGFLELMIHEQFFYSDYKAYLPDFEQRVLTACRFAHSHGYIPTFLMEALS